MLEEVLSRYGIHPKSYTCEEFGNGLINRTWKINTPFQTYILQKINHSIFKNPEGIDHNIRMLRDFLKERYPDYLFIAPLQDLQGQSLLNIESGYFRLFPFEEDSHSLTALNTEDEAFEAAVQFGRFNRLLSDVETAQLQVTLPDFHNLDLRYYEFKEAIGRAGTTRKELAAGSIGDLLRNEDIVDQYRQIIAEQCIPERVVHHDTKISNVLFDAANKGLCVIDLDTVMPGYYLSDVGDMLRTYLSSANEEASPSNVQIRLSFFKAIFEGYHREMGQELTPSEKKLFVYAGRMMIFMQAVRFLTDYLLDDRYYGQRYEGHNLARAQNQIALLKSYKANEARMNEIAGISLY